jgi:hypothetical protein
MHYLIPTLSQNRRKDGAPGEGGGFDFARSALLRTGLRRAETTICFHYPALTPSARVARLGPYWANAGLTHAAPTALGSSWCKISGGSREVLLWKSAGAEAQSEQSVFGMSKTHALTLVSSVILLMSVRRSNARVSTLGLVMVRRFIRYICVGCFTVRAGYRTYVLGGLRSERVIRHRNCAVLQIARVIRHKS